MPQTISEMCPFTHILTSINKRNNLSLYNTPRLNYLVTLQRYVVEEREIRIDWISPIQKLERQLDVKVDSVQFDMDIT